MGSITVCLQQSKSFLVDQMASCISDNDPTKSVGSWPPVGEQAKQDQLQTGLQRASSGPMTNDRFRADQLPRCTSAIGQMLNAHQGSLSEPQWVAVGPMLLAEWVSLVLENRKQFGLLRAVLLY